MTIFYDTCALLNKLHHAFSNEEKFYICDITLKELESIKTSNSKEPDVKFRARRLINLLDKYEDKYEIIYFNSINSNAIFKRNPILDKETNDSKIIATALATHQKEPIQFITEDLCCKNIAKCVGLNVEYLQTKQQDYCGFKIIQVNSNEELAQLYDNYNSKDFELLINEYLLIKDSNGYIIDKYKFTEDGLKPVPYTVFESRMFGKVKPKDDYQLLAMDSMKNNKITMVRGSAGTGKSYLSFGYLFNKLDEGKIDKIIIFCNTVATSGSAKLGYYPGSKDEKLLDSQIGNLLISKFGGRIAVEQMILEEKLVLLPMSDIRGYDTSGMKAGIYISEAQNLDVDLMKLTLQRIGEDSICIIDGDCKTQVDDIHFAGSNNGMRRASQVFRGHDVYGEITLKTIHRSKIATIAEDM